MNAHLIKAICHQLAEELGSHKTVASLAGVAPSVWSDYCSFDKPDTTIPLHRAMAIQEKTGRRDFTRALVDADGEQDARSGDPRILGASALETIARAEVVMALAFADGNITEAEKRELLAIAQRLVERAHDFAACIAGISTTASPCVTQPARPLRAV